MGFRWILSALSWWNYASDPQKFSRCKNVLEVLYHHAKFGGARISPTDGVVKTLVFLFVYLSITLLNTEGCVHDFAMKVLE